MNQRQKRLLQMEQKGYFAIPPKQRAENMKRALERIKTLFLQDYRLL